MEDSKHCMWFETLFGDSKGFYRVSGIFQEIFKAFLELFEIMSTSFQVDFQRF